MENITQYIIKDSGSYELYSTKIMTIRNNYILLQVDYFGYYVPKVWLYRSDYLLNLINNKNNFNTQYKITEEGIHYIDITNIFIETVDFKKMNFTEFKYIFYDILSGREIINKSKLDSIRNFLQYLLIDFDS